MDREEPQCRGCDAFVSECWCAEREAYDEAQSLGARFAQHTCCRTHAADKAWVLFCGQKYDVRAELLDSFMDGWITAIVTQRSE